MLASLQIIIHLAIFLMIVAYKQRCNAENFRLSAGLLAFVIAGFNLACVGYLILIQPHIRLDQYQITNNMMLTSSVVSALGVAFLASMKGLLKDRIMELITLIVNWRK